MINPFDPTPYQTDRYVPNGRAWHAWDCWGLICAVFQREAAISLDPWDTVDADDAPAVASATARESAAGTWLPVEAMALRPLDVLLFLDNGRPTHVGVVIRPPDFLHARKGAGVCVGSLHDRKLPRLHGRLLGAYRHRDLA